MPLWAARFSKETDATVNDFNSSIAFDSRLYAQDIRGSMAHARMLARQGIITGADAGAIIDGLDGILADIERGALVFDPAAEDIHMFIEQELTARIGDAGKRLHTARSRNDQVAVDIRLYLNDALEALLAQIEGFIAVICTQAEAHCDTIMSGYTHLQRAQPIVFGHHLMAYAFMLLRDRERLVEARRRMMRQNPLGSGALAGTTYPIDRHFTSAALGFDGPAPNSLDGVSDRDFCLEIASALAILMTHLSRFSEEIILWCSWEFKYIELDDAFATGSSIMPQKKNPDIAELVRGKTGRVSGNLVALLTVMKGLPLAYNKDMQEDKEAVFDSLDTVKMCLAAFTPMLETMTVLKDNMRAAAAKGFINATDCADYLVKKGMPFRDAYKITGELVAQCIASAQTLESLPLDAYKAKSGLFDADIYTAISLETCLSTRISYGGPGPDSVRAQVTLAREALAAGDHKNR
ncbi:MAG: argininosuccinate lyase [Oscillospiraceae bacterium]|jgi:argininosuccinate lyase|nr:argininosuccinate lyase [Oscillospiraceae bacterium]